MVFIIMFIERIRSFKMPQYVFKMKKGELEIEFSSDDAEFVEQQLEKWREEILKKHAQ